jgi:Protein of unknown function (DUF2569)
MYELIAGTLSYPVGVIFTTATLSAYIGQSVETVTAEMMTPDLVAPWIAAIVLAAIWIPYTKLSKRVANTFK